MAAKRPRIPASEVCVSVKRDLGYQQKRSRILAKET